MIKKVLLIAAALILAISCSKNNPTTPTNNGDTGIGNTGGGSIIEEGTGTSSPTTIADFLKKHEGRYYIQYDKAINPQEIIENGKIYDISSSEEGVEITGQMTLLDNKLQIETINYIEPMNKIIYLYTFENNGITKSTKDIYMKEPTSSTSGYKQLAKVNGLEKYAGSYYNYYYGTQNSMPEKSINFIIDNNGYIYTQIPEGVQVQIKNIALNGDNLVMEMSQIITENAQSYTYNVELSMIFKDSYMIENYQKLDGEYQNIDDLKKSDLLTPYIGTYNSTDGSNITLMITSYRATLIIGGYGYTSGILLGNTLTTTIGSDANNYKDYVIVFSDDKQTATYTDPDTQQKITLTKQGA
ncbi:hypothetical protein [Brachyspira innocens]|uniref:hypothetical protein n=1 Tax=Brachyspira innocens TaxID=13264 RepID=UPI00036C0DCE|nr:hypothetical protein [Brachyspira innocens]